MREGGVRLGHEVRVTAERNPRDPFILEAARIPRIEQSLTQVDPETYRFMLQARSKLRTLVTRRRIPLINITKSMGIDPQRVLDFTAAGIPVNLTWLVQAVDSELPKGKKDPEYAELQEIRYKAEEQTWLSRFAQPKLHFNNFVQDLRLAQVEEDITYRQNARVSERQYSEYQNTDTKPQPFNLNLLLAASPLDPRGKPAQMLRLMAQQEPMMPMSSKFLRDCQDGTLLQFLRIQTGLSNEELQNALSFRTTSRGRLETGERTIFTRHVPAILSKLGIPAESIWDHILRFKIGHPGESLPEDYLRDAYLYGQFLLEEHILYANPLRPANSHKEEKAAIAKLRTFGAKIAELRIIQGLRQIDVGERAGLRRTYVSSLERGEYLPQDHTRVRIARAIDPDYDIFNDVTRALLKCAR